VTCVAVVDGGAGGGAARVVSGSEDSTLCVWDVVDGTRVTTLTSHTECVTCVAVVDGGAAGGTARAVSGSGDKTLRVWDVADGTCVTTLTGHTSLVRCMAVVDGGGGGGAARVVSGSFDMTLRVWDLDTGTCLAVLPQEAVWMSSFSGKHTVPSIGPHLGSLESVRCAVGEASFFGFCDIVGRCALIGDHCRSVRFIGAPPGTTVVCCVSPSCVLLGTQYGGVHVGRFFF